MGTTKLLLRFVTVLLLSGKNAYLVLFVVVAGAIGIVLDFLFMVAGLKYLKAKEWSLSVFSRGSGLAYL